MLDTVRREVENTDCMQGNDDHTSFYPRYFLGFFCCTGFQIMQSIGGGSGAGLGSLVLNRLREEYPDRILSFISLTND